MAKFEVGQRVKVNYRGWEGEGVIHSISDHKGWLNVDMQTGNYAKVQGAFSLNEVEPIVTFQPGDIVRAEKGDAIAQDALRRIGSIETLWLREWRISDYQEKGYTLTLVKRPEPEIVLPTKPYAIVFAGGASHILGFGEMWYLAFGKDDDGITSGQLLAKATVYKGYRVIFEGENE